MLPRKVDVVAESVMAKKWMTYTYMDDTSYSCAKLKGAVITYAISFLAPMNQFRRNKKINFDKGSLKWLSHLTLKHVRIIAPFYGEEVYEIYV